MSEHHAAINEMMADLRCDREELVMLRRTYNDIFKALDDPNLTMRKKLEAVLDALPDRRQYIRISNQERTISLSPQVGGYE